MSILNIFNNQEGWNFPSNENADIKGLQDAGTETFKGSVFSSLAREICQNSLDAKRDVSKPVKVVFELSEIDRSDLPGVDKLSRCISYCPELFEKDKKTKDFFANASKVIDSDKIRVLRVSDYNTTGIWGADNKEYASCPWFDLVRSSGVSNKSGSSGGSFGIGKYAPFACSEIRTIFYSTLDKNGVDAYQGVSNLVSFKDRESKKKITQGKGYYGDKRDNSAILKKFELGNYTRTEMGTDIFIFGFIKDSKWKSEIIRYVIEEYLISILNDKIEVVVDDVLINSKTLDTIVVKYLKENELTYNYYKVLTSEASTIRELDFENLGKIELRVLIENGFKRKVLMARNTGMKIFDKGNISGSIPFAAICILKDEAVNTYFRNMENPQHNKWEEDRHENTKEAKLMKRDLFRLIKKEILDLGKETTLDSMDAVGAGEFIPDLNSSDTKNKSDDECIGNDIKDYSEFEVKKVKKNESPIKLRSKKKVKDEESLDTEPAEESLDGNLEVGVMDESDETPNGGDFGGDSGGLGKSNPEGRTRTRKPKELKNVKTRLFFDNNEKEYKFIFETKYSYEKIEIEFSASGEQGVVKIGMKEAFLNNGTKLDCKGSKIIIRDVEPSSKHIIRAKTNYDELCCMEVKLSGYKK